MTKHTLKLRPATADDRDLIYSLICELAVYEKRDLSKLPLTKKNLERFGFGDHPYFLVELAEMAGVAVGYALYFYTFSANQGYPVLYLEDLYVRKAHRQNKIGAKLLEKLSIYAKEHSCCRMEWYVLRWNQSAIDFYLKMGAILKDDYLKFHLEPKGV